VRESGKPAKKASTWINLKPFPEDISDDKGIWLCKEKKNIVEKKSRGVLKKESSGPTPFRPQGKTLSSPRRTGQG